MSDIVRTEVREREPSTSDSYDRCIKYLSALRDRAFKGRIVIREEDQPWEQSRQGRLKHYLCREADSGTVSAWLPGRGLYTEKASPIESVRHFGDLRVI